MREVGVFTGPRDPRPPSEASLCPAAPSVATKAKAWRLPVPTVVGQRPLGPRLDHFYQCPKGAVENGIRRRTLKTRTQLKPHALVGPTVCSEPALQSEGERIFCEVFS